ncbi:hypothetical protein LXA43DRAFT_1088778 [Ganoderma leucocontextum]|nr:hypothetical protein LXA43DRAFT_1088778 [Ganoderma leucocontextum]
MLPQISLDLEPAGTGQAPEYDDGDLASLSLMARLHIADANERLANLGNHKEHGEAAMTDETLAAVLELQEAALLIQSVSAASITRPDGARQAGQAEPTDQGAHERYVQLERAVPRPGAAAEPRLLPVEAIARSPVSPSISCAVCMTDIDGEVIRAPCGHTWDVPCLSELFQRATKDESLFPPTCCGRPLPLSLVRDHIGDELVSLFLEKEQEHETSRRVYCVVPSCSVFLGPATDTPSKLFCHKCGTRTTCAHCSGRAHSRSIRCASPDDAELAALAEREGWRRCQRCGHMVELTFGCNHMTCRCRFEFCYVCGAPWKICDCPQWHEERLRAAAEDAAQWRPLGHGDMRLVDDFADEEREEDWEEQGEDDHGPDDNDGEEFDHPEAAYHHPPPVLDLDLLQPEPVILPPEPRADDSTTRKKNGQSDCDCRQVADTTVTGSTFGFKISIPMVRWCTRVGAVDVLTLKSGSVRVA